MFTFLHAADLHLDSPLKGLAEVDPSLRATIQEATRDAVTNLIGLAQREAVSFVLLSGDLFDGDIQDPGTGHFLLNRLGALGQTIPVFLIRGNHDALNQMSAGLRWPKGVRQLGTTQPETIRLDDLKVAIHGRSFGSRAEDSNLAADYPEAVEGYFNIGMLHTSLTGSDGHNSYAPTTPEQLMVKRYDYWALGHIHKREVVRSARPAIVFPGNIQGRSIRETGPRGCAVVRADLQGRCEIQFEDLDTVRWESVLVDLNGLRDREELHSRIEGAVLASTQDSGRQVHVVRITFSGPGDQVEDWKGDRNLRGIIQDLVAGLGRGICLEKLKWVVTTASGNRTRESTEDLDLVREMVAQFSANPEELKKLLQNDPSWKGLGDRLSKVFSRTDIERMGDPAELLASVPGLYESLRDQTDPGIKNPK